MRTVLQDLRYAVRNLRNARGFAIVAAATLAIGIGANTAIFSIIDTVLLRPLPYSHPEQLVRLNETEAAPGRYPFSGPDFVDWRAQNTTFQDMTLFAWPTDLNLNSGGQPEHIIALPTAVNFFDLLGVKPILGRTWAAGEDQPGNEAVIVLSYGLWQSRFAGDRQILGRQIEINARKFNVVGVMPGSFRFPLKSDAWVPQLMDTKTLGNRGSHWANAIGRLKPGVGLKAALADLKTVAGRLTKQYPDSNIHTGAAVRWLRDDMVGKAKDSLFLLLGAVGLVLLIACANVANLLLTRAMARQKEVAIRSALGASRGRLLRQLLTENLLLSLTGGAAGLGLAFFIARAFSSAKSYSLPQFNSVELNGTVLAFTFALAIVTGLLFGAFPALQMSRPDLFDELKGGAGASISHGRSRRLTSNVLVVVEIALSLVLLVSAGLLLKDFATMRGLDIGVRREGVWTAALRLPNAAYKKGEQKYEFSQRLLEQARRIPGVDAAALTDHLPLEGGSNYYVKLRGQTTEASNQLVETHDVTTDYFRTLGIRLLQGRVFTQADIDQTRANDEKVTPFYEGNHPPPAELTDALVYPVVINESMAKFFWPNESPLGKMFSQGSAQGPWRQVIGVVGNVNAWSLTDKPVPEAYNTFTGDSRLFLVVHSSLAPSSMTAPARRAVAQVDGTLPLYSIRSMDEVVAQQAQGQQFLSALVGSFAALAALLAAIGIYGVLSYLVTQRTREIGIRMSLGASRTRVLRALLWEGMQLAVIGLVVGAMGSYAAGKLLASLLQEVKPKDPTILIATAILLGAVALAACYIPARRAAKLDPMIALRYE